jgi:chemotaxis protein MotB
MVKRRRRIISVAFILLLFIFVPSVSLLAGGNKALKEELAQCKEARQALEQENSQLKTEKGQLESRITTLESEKSELQARVDELEAELDKWNSQLKAYGIEPTDPSVVSKTVAETLQEKDAQIVELESNVKELKREIEQKQSEIDRINHELEQLEIKNSLYDRKIADLQAENQELKDTVAMYEKIEEDAKILMDNAILRIQDVLRDEIDAGEVRVFKGTLGLTLDIVSGFMFDSGSVRLNPKGQVILGKIASILDDLDGYFIGVIGNADADPIVSSSLRNKYPTNWELSSVRGAVVVRYILANSTVSPGRMVAMGLGEYYPIDNNTTKDGKGNNRRIDIVLLPMDVLASVVIGVEIK